MNQSLMPWKTLAATVGVGVLSDGWNLADPPSADEPRVFTLEVAFASAFFSTPVVTLGLTGFDMDPYTASRISLKVVDPSRTGFKVEIATWRDSRVYSVEFNWFAIGA
ncbi:MAG: hypothetical protein JWO08_4106 [Verrucomicrobiaceae bacterium]|nr:hypothetical protein [Verrucomicrobiaceae bacterium]